MAITHVQTIRDTFAQDVLDDIDGGPGNGQCVLYQVAAEVATIPLLKPSFTRSNHTLTLITTTDREDTSATGGTPDNFKFEDSTGTEVFSGAIPDDMTLSSGTIGVGDTVRLTSYTYNAAP